jgi:type IV pilus assembly protein PilC
MATAKKPEKSNEIRYSWEGKDKGGKIIKGEIRAAGTAAASAQLRRQGIQVSSLKKTKSIGKAITEKDITLFTRQLATMLKSGVPLLQSFDIVGKGHSNPSVARMLMDIKTEVETGSSLEMAFRKYPLQFDDLFCNLIGAGEAAGILDNLLDKIATYKEKIQAIKSKIKSALFYPVSIIVIAFVITAVIMIFVIPAFKELFKSFGADLPTPTLVIMAISDWFVTWWWAIFSIITGLYTFFYYWNEYRCSARWISSC